MRDFNDQARPPPNHEKELIDHIEGLAHRHSSWQVFADFCEMAAISVSNAVDLALRDKREQRYLEIVKRYRTDELAKFPQMMAALTLALETAPSDVLGRTFHALGLHNKWAGQFFTPDNVCRMMAKMTLADAVHMEERIAERGFITAQEPAVGSGAMIIALADEMRASGVNYQQHLHVTAIDIDAKCVHMAYLQFALLHIPACVVHGNTLGLEEWDHWYTPAHIFGSWSRKLRQTATHGETHEIARPPEQAPSAINGDDMPPLPPSQLTLF